MAAIGGERWRGVEVERIDLANQVRRLGIGGHLETEQIIQRHTPPFSEKQGTESVSDVVVATDHELRQVESIDGRRARFLDDFDTHFTRKVLFINGFTQC